MAKSQFHGRSAAEAIGARRAHTRRYATDEQRSNQGWMDARMPSYFSDGALGPPFLLPGAWILLGPGWASLSWCPDERQQGGYEEQEHHGRQDRHDGDEHRRPPAGGCAAEILAP